jgi:hypothetical protein
MDMNSIIIAIVATVVIVLFLVAVAVLGYWAVKSREKRAAREQEMSRLLKQFCEASDKLAESLKLAADMPQFVKGQTIGIKALSIEVAKFRVAAEKLSNILTQPSAEKSGYSVAKEEDADLQYRTAELIAIDPTLTFEQAAEKAKNEVIEGASRPSFSLDFDV